jgi:hypothetical protein
MGEIQRERDREGNRGIDIRTDRGETIVRDTEKREGGRERF